MQRDSGDYDFETIKRFEEMLRSNTVSFFDSSEFETIIEYYLEEGKIKKARRAIKLGVEQHPFSENLKLLRAETLIFDNRFEDAEMALNELQELDPKNPEIYIQKANILSKTDDHKNAIPLLFTALELTDDLADVHSLLGMEYLYMDDFRNARKHFMLCLQEDELDYTALYNVIYCFDFLNEREQAVEFLNRYLDKNPYSEVAWHQLGKLFVELEQYEKALSSFEFAVISDDQFIGAYLEMGKVLEKLGRYNEAINNYLLTLEIDDPTAFAYLRLGRCHEKLGNTKLSVDYLKKCVTEDPLMERGWIALTDHYLKKLDYQNALIQIEKATDIDGENGQYWLRYAAIYRHLELYEEAEYGYRRAIELGHYELETWISRCDMLLKLGEHRAAIKNCKQALDFYPSDPELEFRLSGLYYTVQDMVKGRFHLQNAMRTDSDFEIILDELFPAVAKHPEVLLTIANHTFQ